MMIAIPNVGVEFTLDGVSHKLIFGDDRDDLLTIVRALRQNGAGPITIYRDAEVAGNNLHHWKYPERYPALTADGRLAVPSDRSSDAAIT